MKKMTWEQKYCEFLEETLKMLRYPVAYDEKKWFEYNLNSRRFSDHTDMGTWYQEQYQLFYDFQMLAYRAQLFINLVELKHQFPELRLCKKLEEGTDLIMKNKFFPVPLTDTNIDSGKVLTFSDGTDVGSFASNCKSDLNTNRFSPETKALVIDFLNLKNYIVSKKLKQKLDEATKVIRTKNLMSRKQDKNPTFSDGTSINEFLKNCNSKYINNKFSHADRCYYEQFLFTKRMFYMRQFITKMRELVKFSFEICDFPNKKYYSDSKTGTFYDGSDMGLFVSKHRKKLENDELNNYEKRMFALYIKMVDKKKMEHNRNMLKEKLFETINISASIGCLPVATSSSYINPRVVFYSDGTNVGSYLGNIKQKIKNKKLDEYSIKLFEEFFKIDFEKEKEWHDNYNMLVEYYNENNNLDINPSDPILMPFIRSELNKINSNTEGLLQEYHEYRLRQIGSKMVNDVIDQKRKIKI